MLGIPNKIKNRGIYISGIRGVTQNAVLEALEAETGTKLDVKHAEITGVKAKALEAMKNGQMRPAMMGLRIFGIRWRMILLVWSRFLWGKRWKKWWRRKGFNEEFWMLLQ